MKFEAVIFACAVAWPWPEAFRPVDFGPRIAPDRLDEVGAAGNVEWRRGAAGGDDNPSGAVSASTGGLRIL
jgi:hypothetical protein